LPVSVHITFGNTPTGVGKTLTHRGQDLFLQKHPHGRGEDGLTWSTIFSKTETPPRAWGRLGRVALYSLDSRNTPTGVGKTTLESTSKRLRWKHPHGRGEDQELQPFPLQVLETPPRAWGRRTGTNNRTLTSGNTPTGVGKTHEGYLGLGLKGKHPHGRGEDASNSGFMHRIKETPPRAWGRQ